MVGKRGPQSPSNYVFPSWGGTFHSRSSAQDHKSVPQGVRLHQVGPQEIESTPWVHTAEYLRESQANSLSKLAAPAKSANSKPGSQRAGSTWKSAISQAVCLQWLVPSMAASSSWVRKPGPRATTSTSPWWVHEQASRRRVRTWQGGRHVHKRLSAARSKAQARVISPIHQPKLGF